MELEIYDVGDFSDLAALPCNYYYYLIGCCFALHRRAELKR